MDEKSRKEFAKILVDGLKKRNQEREKIFDSALKKESLSFDELKIAVEYSIQKHMYKEMYYIINHYKIDVNRVLKNGLIGTFLDNIPSNISEDQNHDISRLISMCNVDRKYVGGVFSYHMLQQAVYRVKDLDGYHKDIVIKMFNKIENKQQIVTDDYGGRMPLDTFLEENGFPINEDHEKQSPNNFDKEKLQQKLKANGFTQSNNLYFKHYQPVFNILDFWKSKGTKTIEIYLDKEMIVYLFKKSQSNFVEVSFDFKKGTARVKFNISFQGDPKSLYTSEYLIKKFDTVKADYYGVIILSHEYDIETCEYIRSHSVGSHKGFEKFVEEAKQFLQLRLSSVLTNKKLNIFQS